MPRRLLGVFMLLLVSVTLVRAQGDVVLLTVGDEKVGKSEFEYHFSKSSEKRADVFAETYARFKQKVQYAKSLGLDTLPEHRLRQEECLRVWKHGKLSANDGAHVSRTAKEWIRLVHVTCRLKQSDGKKDELRGKQYLDSLYSEWKDRASWQDQAEVLSWIQTRHLLNEWQVQLQGLKQNELSKPFTSPLGVHLIAWTDRVSEHPLALKDVAENDSIRLKEMEDGLLAVALERYWNEGIVCTARDLELFFKEHRADYGGGTPHFRGAVIHCRSKKEAKAIKKYLRQYPESMWAEAVRQMPADMAEGCRVETGLFAIGKNPYVDKLVFKCGEFQSLPDFPYTWTLGKKLKKGPADYRDVLEKVEKDCREAKKMAEMEAFLQKNRVEIDKEVLKTVNRAVNK
jgi:peptidyl-prolyl cis-trans isomerase SurA